MHTDRKKPTPTPTASSRMVESMCGTVLASTCKSGSATVTAKPSTKLMPKMTGRLRLRVSAVPILLPMGVMEISAPRENRPMPTTIRRLPAKKLSSRSVCSGTMVRHSAATITMIGSTERRDSLSFSAMAVRLLPRKDLFKSGAYLSAQGAFSSLNCTKNPKNCQQTNCK